MIANAVQCNSLDSTDSAVGKSFLDLQEGIVSQRWLFTTQHKQLSADEVDLYERHSQAGEEIDEDFFDNFS